VSRKIVVELTPAQAQVLIDAAVRAEDEWEVEIEEGPGLKDRHDLLVLNRARYAIRVALDLTSIPRVR
jgi:hypothetical protein